jgi:predicted nucleic acid-binding protein
MKHNSAIIVDTSFWFALFTPGDSHHTMASNKASILDRARLIFPWPVLYETINTKLIKNRGGIMRLDSLIKSRNAILIDDTDYRRIALQATIRESHAQARTISLVDMIIRFVIDDPNIRIAALLTFNERDFADICLKRRVELL